MSLLTGPRISNIPHLCLSIPSVGQPVRPNPSPNKLIPQLTCKSKVQGQMQIPEKQTVANLAVNQLITE